MSLSVVAIIGRPNVGKSRLFNRLIGKYQALVDDQPGVTRDRHYGYADWRDKRYLLIDTGGIIPGAEEPLNRKVWDQAFQAVQEADILLCLLDGKEGVTPVDEALIDSLRKTNKPVFYAVNKIDTDTHEKEIFDFAKLGILPVFGVSAEHGRGVADLLEALYPKLAASEPALLEERGLRLSIVGRPNVGKSTLLNHLAGEDRVVVHEEAGTTRDAIHIIIERENKKYTFVDTAGIKRKKNTKTRLEKFSVVAALKSIDQSDIVLYLFDALEGVTHHDLHMLHLIWESKKGLLIVVNKWDLMKVSPHKFVFGLRPQLKELQAAPVLCLSAKTGRACDKLWDRIEEIQNGMTKRFPTAGLNAWLEDVLLSHPVPSYKGREIKFFYATQVGTRPPHVVIFVNEPKGIPLTYKRYIMHRFEEAMEIQGIPVRLSFRKR